jgi:RimJ/RimL family protein N-acetyltransferase
MRVPVLKTERITLRPLRKRDVPWLVELAIDPEVRRTTLQPFVTSRTAKATAIYETQVEIPKWAIEDRSKAISVGWIALDYNGLPPAVGPTVGFEIRRRFWNSGYATAALLRVAEHLFGERDFRFLSGLVFVDNTASRKVFTKVGFEDFGPCICQGHPCTEYRLSLAAFERVMPPREALRPAPSLGAHIANWWSCVPWRK